MFANLALGLLTMTVCLLLQGAMIITALRYLSQRRERLQSSFLHAMRTLSGLMLTLILGITAQFTVWATLFFALGEFNTLSAAIYHSAVNFATLGYGDIVMSLEYRLLGPLEAINGALMIGVSTAALTRAFHEAVKQQSDRQ